MKLFAVTLLLCALGGAHATETHPIEKVINMLEGLKEKSIAEGKDEAVSFTKFQYWCSTSKTELNNAISDENEKIDELTDELAGLKKQKETLETEIETLEGQIAKNEAAAKSAKEIRGTTEKLYNKANEDLGNTIKAMGECIKALSGAQGSTESMLLAQRHVKMVLSLISMKVTETQRKGLEGFAQRPDQLAAGNKAEHVDKYDFKSENVIELLKQLELKFEDDRLAGTKAETNSVNSYNLAKSARDNAHDAATKSKDEKTTALGETNSAIADAKAALTSTEEDHEADSATLSATTDECRIKTEQWETRSETRSLEIEAMDMAMKILAKSSGVRNVLLGLGILLIRIGQLLSLRIGLLLTGLDLVFLGSLQLFISFLARHFFLL
jgi:hypothetical protein